MSKVRAFLGFIGYYHHFINGYCKIDVSLTRMLYTNAQYMWNEEEQRAFEKMQKIKIPLMHYTMLRHDIYLAIDASQNIIGAELYDLDEEGVKNQLLPRLWPGVGMHIVT